MDGILDNVSNDVFREMVKKSNTWKELAIALGYKKTTARINHKLRQRAIQLGMSDDPFKEKRKMANKANSIWKYTDKEFENFVQQSTSWNDLYRKLGYSHSQGGPQSPIQNRVRQLNLSTAHFVTFDKQQFNKVDNADIFIENSKASHATLRRRVLKNNLLPYVCNVCGMKPYWQDKPLTLVLDHINGNHTDNRLENLQWVCPNCNSQLPTFTGRNKKQS